LDGRDDLIIRQPYRQKGEFTRDQEWRTFLKYRLAFAFLIIPLSLMAQRKSGDPLDHLPPNEEVLSYYGERPDISPDNQHIAFMVKSFGDAMVVDLKTRAVRCLTCNVPAAAFLRVMYLPTGDYLLVGPAKFVDIQASRSRDNELWFLSWQPGSKPVRMGVKLSEGIAISKISNKVAFSELPAQFPDMPPLDSRLITAEVDTTGPIPKLTNRKVVYESHSDSCRLEAQDFYDKDGKMTFTCYDNHDKRNGGDQYAIVMGIDLNTNHVTDFSKAPDTYNETEGIFPDGQFTCVEGDRHVAQVGGHHGNMNIEIYKLRLDGTGKDFVRLTRFNEYQGFKSANPVVSTDGRFMAFQIGRSGEEAGVGYGIILEKF
jgi:hypothetical protein